MKKRILVALESDKMASAKEYSWRYSAFLDTLAAWLAMLAHDWSTTLVQTAVSQQLSDGLPFIFFSRRLLCPQDEAY